MLRHARPTGGLPSAEVGVSLVLNGKPDRCSPVLETYFPAIRTRPCGFLELAVRLCNHVSLSRFDGRQRGTRSRRGGSFEAEPVLPSPLSPLLLEVLTFVYNVLIHSPAGDRQTPQERRLEERLPFPKPRHALPCAGMIPLPFGRVLVDAEVSL